MCKKDVILLHVIQPDVKGGTKTVIDDIKKSYLAKKYDLKELAQNEVCGFNPFKAVRFINKYKTIIQNSGARAIYVCGLEYSSFLITIAARIAHNIKIILSIHGLDSQRPDQSIVRKVLFNYIIDPVTIRLSDAAFTVCNKALESKVIRRGDKNNVVGTIYNECPRIDYESITKGIINNEYGIPSNKLIVSVVGRVTEGKGHRYIIDSIKQVNDDFVFLIVGTGDYVDVYKKEMADDLRKGKVILSGVRSDVYNILADTDIFLFASLHENHSKALLEAACMKCAIICTDVGGNTEIISDNYSGIVIPSRDSKAISNALNRYTDKNLRKLHANQAHRSVREKFSTDNTMGKLDKLFHDVLSH